MRLGERETESAKHKQGLEGRGMVIWELGMGGGESRKIESILFIFLLKNLNYRCLV